MIVSLTPWPGGFFKLETHRLSLLPRACSVLPNHLSAAPLLMGHRRGQVYPDVVSAYTQSTYFWLREDEDDSGLGHSLSTASSSNFPGDNLPCSVNRWYWGPVSVLALVC
jgi:hypothetical protein